MCGRWRRVRLSCRAVRHEARPGQPGFVLGRATLYRYSKADLSKPSKEEITATGQGSLNVMLPPLSIGLLVSVEQ